MDDQDPTFTYQGHRFLWGYSADREYCGLWEVEDPTGPPLRTWPIAEHEHAWQVFRSTEPRAAPYVAPDPTSSSVPDSTASRSGPPVSETSAAPRLRIARPDLRALLTFAGVALAGVEIAVIALFLQGSSAALPPGETLSHFESTIRSDIGVRGITTVNCDLPSAWKPGRTFTCTMYGSDGHAIGSVFGTVVNTQRGYLWNANLNWQPNPTGTG